MSTWQELEIPGVPHPQPFPHGVKVGNIIFSSGIDPVDPATGKPAEGIERQAEQVFLNLRTLLAAGGGTPADAGQVIVYMQDPAERAVLNRYWLETFPEEHHRPARKTIPFDFGSSGIRVQLQVIAVL